MPARANAMERAKTAEDARLQLHLFKLSLADTIETLITILDALEGDADFEEQCDDEGSDGGDFEPDEPDGASQEHFSGPDPWEAG